MPSRRAQKRKAAPHAFRPLAILRDVSLLAVNLVILLPRLVTCPIIAAQQSQKAESEYTGNRVHGGIERQRGEKGDDYVLHKLQVARRCVSSKEDRAVRVGQQSIKRTQITARKGRNNRHPKRSDTTLAILWRDGRSVYILESSTLHHLRSFERQVYPQEER